MQILRTNNPSNLYLAFIVDIVILFMEPHSVDLLEVVSSTTLLTLENAGCLGSRNCSSLVSIVVTSDIFGLSIALSSTHSKPT